MRIPGRASSSRLKLLSAILSEPKPRRMLRGGQGTGQVGSQGRCARGRRERRSRGRANEAHSAASAKDESCGEGNGSQPFLPNLGEAAPKEGVDSDRFQTFSPVFHRF